MRRPVAAGLNLLWPGLGLLRIGAAAPGMTFAAVPFAALILGFAARAVGVADREAAWAGVAAAIVAAMAASAFLVWRRSSAAAPPDDWWTRKRWLAALWLAALAAAFLVPGPAGYLKRYYLPSEAMEPTLETGDRFVARIGVRPDVRRGDILVVTSPHGAAYVKRVAALPGDRIAVREGIVYLNARAVPQRAVSMQGNAAPGEARRLAEQFPGEEGEHQIYDSGRTAMDDFPEVRVRPGHIFMLGDNRDRSADSRVPAEDSGLGQLPMGAVRGKLLFEL